METYLLILVYIIFTSVGLSTFILGSAWPVMQQDLLLPLSGAGVLSVIISSGMILSSFFGGKIIKWCGTGKTFLVSMVMTALAVLSYGKLPTFSMLCLVSFPFGLGLGALNMSSNHFISLNYKPSHMNWMHGFWGIGATVGPLIMSYYIGKNNNWKKGYLAISIIYFVIAGILLLSFSFFKNEQKQLGADKEEKSNDINTVLKMSKLKYTLVCFFCCCAVEQTIGLWGSSYLLKSKNISAELAAACLSIFFAGVTIGRFVSGIITLKIKTTTLIKMGLWIEVAGGIFLIVPLPVTFSMLGLVLIGFGSSPVVPCMTQQTAHKFGKEVSGAIVGYQIAFGFMGSTLIPPIFGCFASKITIAIFPLVILILILILVVSNSRIE